jgi:hypothetical protein
LAGLLIICLGRNDGELLRLTCNLVTELCTAFESFEDMLGQAVHGYRPGLDPSFFEQRFLLDQYSKALAAKSPHLP